MNAVIILFSVLAVTFGQHQHPDPHAHNQNVHEEFSFKYNQQENKMVAMIGHDECYIYTMTTQEQTDLLSSSDALRTLEFKVLQKIQNYQGSASPPPTTTSAPHDHGHHDPLEHLCHSAHNVVMLN